MTRASNKARRPRGRHAPLSSVELSQVRGGGDGRIGDVIYVPPDPDPPPTRPT